MAGEAQTTHEWLQRLVGEWTYEMEAAGADGELTKLRGTESVRLLGVWVVCEARGEHSDKSTGMSLMTLGYDPVRERFAGTFVASIMAHLWIYEGQLDATGTMLTLETEGPSFEVEGETAKYRDIIKVRGENHRIMTSSYLRPDGEWRQFMTMQYRRPA